MVTTNSILEMTHLQRILQKFLFILLLYTVFHLFGLSLKSNISLDQKIWYYRKKNKVPFIAFLCSSPKTYTCLKEKRKKKHCLNCISGSKMKPNHCRLPYLIDCNDKNLVAWILKFETYNEHVKKLSSRLHPTIIISFNIDQNTPFDSYFPPVKGRLLQTT